MDETQKFESSNLPPKRRQPTFSDQQISEQDSLESKKIKDTRVEEEIDPELLAAFEQARQDTGSGVKLDFTNDLRVTAPILKEYIDPYTVPITYLLDQARLDVEAQTAFENMQAEES